MTAFNAQERTLRRLLQFIAFVSGLLGLVLSFRLAEAGAGLGLAAFVAWFASADVRRFRYLAWTACGALGLLTVFSLILAVELPAPSAAVLSVRPFVVIATITAGGFALALMAAILRTEQSSETILPWKTRKPRTRAERLAQFAFGIVAFVGLVLAFLVLYSPSRMMFEMRGAQTGVEFVPAAGLFFALMAMLALTAALDLRAHGEAMTLLVIGLVLALLGTMAAPLGVAPYTRPVSAPWYFLSPAQIALLYALAALGIWLLRGWVNRALIDFVKFFTPGQFWALAAISDGLIEGGAHELLKPHEIALRVDNHLSSFPAPKLALSRLALAALDIVMPFAFTLRPPLSYMHLSERTEFLNRQFKVDIIEKRGLYALLDRLKLESVTELIEGVMRFIMQFAYLGYYGEPKVQKIIGYTRFSERAAARSLAAKPIRRYAPLGVTTPNDLDRMGTDLIDDADVVIIGSGAAGSILAERMLERGRRVLLLEKGRHIQPDAFTEDEVDMIGRLYGDNALQVTSSLNFTILQGSCVGGTTVVNNAVSFPTPDGVLKRWNDEYNAQIEPSAYWQSQGEVMERLSIRPVTSSAVTRPADEIVNPVAKRLRAGIDSVLGESGYVYSPVSANIVDCLGCGYCNLGCKYGRKLSMLDEVLPKAQRDYGDRFEILSEAEAVHLSAEGDTVTDIAVRIGGRRTLHIRRPKTVIVAGGTIASSWLLMRSGIGSTLPVGRRLCFNMGSPLHAEFDEPINAYDGLQISHYLQLDGQHDFIYETWFNPPVAQALVMPGWLDTHFQNMSAYNRMVAMGIVVGTDARMDTYIREAALFPGSPEVVYTPSREDLDKLVAAMITMGRVLLASGASRVLASTKRYHSYTSLRAQYTSEDDLDDLHRLVKTDDDLLLSSAHPQGGNALGSVLDADFRVKGYKNLYVCDASVFPSSVTVNPQLTVMNLAWYAGGRIQ